MEDSKATAGFLEPPDNEDTRLRACCACASQDHHPECGDWKGIEWEMCLSRNGGLAMNVESFTGRQPFHPFRP